MKPGVISVEHEKIRNNFEERSVQCFSHLLSIDWQKEITKTADSKNETKVIHNNNASNNRREYIINYTSYSHIVINQEFLLAVFIIHTVNTLRKTKQQIAEIDL